MLVVYRLARVKILVLSKVVFRSSAILFSKIGNGCGIRLIVDLQWYDCNPYLQYM